jgi:hypothetical protein
MQNPRFETAQQAWWDPEQPAEGRLVKAGSSSSGEDRRRESRERVAFCRQVSHDTRKHARRLRPPLSARVTCPRRFVAGGHATRGMAARGAKRGSRAASRPRASLVRLTT